MPYLSTAASVSPPPAIENASDAAIARASASVPLPNASNSNTPTGPFQTTRAGLRDQLARSARAVSRADVEDHVVGADRIDAP